MGDHLMGLANLPETEPTASESTASALVSGPRPNPVTSLTANTLSTYLDARGNERGVVGLTWADPTTNTDGSTLYLREIKVQWKRTTATNWKHTSVLPGVQSFDFDDLLVGVECQFQAYACAGVNRTSVVAGPITYTPASDGVAPSTPTAPTLLGTGQRGLKVTHDLNKAAGGKLEIDLDYLLVYLDTSAAVTLDAAHLAGDIPAGFAAIDAGNSVHGHFNSYGTTATVKGATYYCKVVPVDKAGNFDPANVSAASSGVAAGANTGAGPSQPTPPTLLGTGQRGLKVTHDLQKAATGNLEATTASLLVYLDTDSTVPTTADYLAGEIPVPPGHLIGTAKPVHGHFNSYGANRCIRGTTYYAVVVPVDDANNAGTVSAASSGVAAGAEVGDALGTPPTPTVSAIRSGVRVLINLADGTPDYGPAHLDVVTVHYYGGSSTSPTTEIGERHVSREALAASKTIRKDLAVAFGTTSTYYVRIKTENSNGDLSDYSADGSATIAVIPVEELGNTGAGAMTALITLTSTGIIQSASGYSVGGAVQAVVLSAAGNDRLTFYSGSTSVNGEPYIGTLSASSSTLAIHGATTAGYPTGSYLLIQPADMTIRGGGTASFGVQSGANLSATATYLQASAPVYLPAGTAAAPSLALVGDSSSGLYFDGSLLCVSYGGVGQVKFGDGLFKPVTDNDVDLGSATYTFKDGYFYTIYDEAGSCYLDLSGISLVNPDNTRLVAGTTNVQLDTYEGAAFQGRVVAAQGGNITIYDCDGHIRQRWVDGGVISLRLADETIAFRIDASGNDPVNVMVSGGLHNVTEGAADSGGAGYKVLRVPN